MCLVFVWRRLAVGRWSGVRRVRVEKGRGERGVLFRRLLEDVLVLASYR